MQKSGYVWGNGHSKFRCNCFSKTRRPQTTGAFLPSAGATIVLTLGCCLKRQRKSRWPSNLIRAGVYVRRSCHDETTESNITVCLRAYRNLFHRIHPGCFHSNRCAAHGKQQAWWEGSNMILTEGPPQKVHPQWIPE